MSLIIRATGSIGAGSGLTPLWRELYGFPANDDLKALYLFEDGAVDSTPTSILDSSGNGADAVLLTGAQIKKTAEGVKTGDTLDEGWFAKTPVPTGSFSMVGVTRNRTPLPTANGIPMIWGSSGNWSAGAAAMTEGNTLNIGTRGLLSLNHFSASGGLSVPEIGVLNYDTASTGWGDVSPSIRKVVQGTGVKDQWQAFALSLDAATGTVILRGFGQTVTFTDLAAATAYLAGTNHWVIGFGKYTTALNAIIGDVGLFAIYDTARDVAALDVLIAAAKARMALRGVTAL